MKILSYLPLLFICYFAQAQNVTSTGQAGGSTGQLIGKYIDTTRPSFFNKSTIATIAVGFGDYYRSQYKVPTGFTLNNNSGFAPVFFKLEEGVSKNVSIAATFCYDAFYSNFYQLFQGANGNEYKRFRSDKSKIFSAGLAAYYHFSSLIPNKKLDLFAGVGFSLNNISHTALPQGDSTLATTDHTVSPMLKAGARYYLTNHGSIFADLGYDRKAIFSLGFSCRFYKK